MKSRSVPAARLRWPSPSRFRRAFSKSPRRLCRPGSIPARHVVFSTLHGTFGEDGGMQRLLDAAGIVYAGCDAASSELTMDKTRTKDAAATRGVRIADAVPVRCGSQADGRCDCRKARPQCRREAQCRRQQRRARCVSTRAELADKLAARYRQQPWLIERRIIGRELSVGVLAGRAMGIVEIRPKSGVYDFTSKYTKGMTEYFAPAPLDAATTAQVPRAAECAFAACGCRDYARVDFILPADGDAFLLEINTLPA